MAVVIVIVLRTIFFVVIFVCGVLLMDYCFSVQRIPFFPKLFRSGSIHFKMDRLWILRLLCAGLNSDVDAKIYMKQEVLNLLLSFFGSSLADHESKILILQVFQILLQYLYLIFLCMSVIFDL